MTACVFLSVPSTSSRGTSASAVQSNTTSFDHVKRPMNAFMVWSTKRRKELAKENPTVHNSVLSKRLGIEWRALSEKDKLPYIKAAMKIRERHNAKYPGYRYSSKKKKKQSEVRHLSTVYRAVALTGMGHMQHVIHHHPVSSRPASSVDSPLRGSPLQQPTVSFAGHSAPFLSVPSQQPTILLHQPTNPSVQPTIPSVLLQQLPVQPVASTQSRTSPLQQLTYSLTTIHQHQPSTTSSNSHLERIPLSQQQLPVVSSAGSCPSTASETLQQQPVIHYVDGSPPQRYQPVISSAGSSGRQQPVIPSHSVQTSLEEPPVICIDDSPLQQYQQSVNSPAGCSGGSSPVSVISSEGCLVPTSLPAVAPSADDSDHSVQFSPSEQLPVVASADCVVMTAVQQQQSTSSFSGGEDEVSVLTEVPLLPIVNSITSHGMAGVNGINSECQGIDYIIHKAILQATYRATRVADVPALPVICLDDSPLQQYQPVVSSVVCSPVQQQSVVSSEGCLVPTTLLQVTAVDDVDVDNDEWSNNVLGNSPASLVAVNDTHTGVEPSSTTNAISPSNSKPPSSPLSGRSSHLPLPPLILVDSLNAQEAEHFVSPVTSHVATLTSYTITATQSRLKGNNVAINWSAST